MFPSTTPLVYCCQALTQAMGRFSLLLEAHEGDFLILPKMVGRS